MKSVFDKEEAYWKAKFNSEDSMSILPYSSTTSQSTSSEQKSDLSVITHPLPSELSDRIFSLANGSDMAVYMILFAGIACLIHKYTHREHVLLGMPAVGSSLDETSTSDEILIIKTDVSSDSHFRSLLGQIKFAIGEALDHQHIPFRKMVQQLSMQYDNRGLPVINTIVTYSSVHTDAVKLDATVEVLFHFQRDQNGLHLHISYNNSRYDANYLSTLTEHYDRLLRTVLFQTELEIGKVELLSEAEQHQLLYQFNDVWTDYPRQATLHGLFEEHVQQQPEAIAVSFEQKRLTYRELNARANQLARTLRANGVGCDKLVGLMAERSLDMIVGMLAVLKAGGAYVAIDPEYPEERIRYMLEDAGAHVKLVQRHLQNRVPDMTGEGCLLLLDDEQSYNADGSNLAPLSAAESLACVIYTSGTTGKPKGNLTSHRNLVRITRNTNYIEITEQDKVLQLSSYSFDGSAFDIFGALTNGAHLVLVPKETLLDATKLAALITGERISVMLITTAYFNVLVDVNTACLNDVRVILFGGERVSVAHVRKALQQIGPGKLKHAYGPSESTVYATWYDVNEVPEDAVNVPIGRPLSNTTLYIVDERNALQPIGVAGELCVGGEGLVRGYLNRPDLTAEKFVQNPFISGERMYRTGDLARWLPDGNVEYVGRIDDQVKIRGFRIEVGEVEAQLLKVESILKATVIVRGSDSSEKQLCAYYVADRPLPPSELKRLLAQDLPSYMIPAYLIPLERMPLTTNGKVDRKALPSPEDYVQAETEYVAPRTAHERLLARIWQDVLGLTKVGVKDNFFELGGHSLRATTLVSKLHKEENISLSLRDVFRYPTLEALAAFIANLEQEAHVSIPVIEDSDYYPLSSVQKRLFILHQLEGAEQSYNMPGAMLVEGALDKERLATAFRTLIARHETLRTGFEMVNGEPVQRVYTEVPFAIEVMQSDDENCTARMQQFIRSFDLEHPPLLRVGLIELAPERHILLFDMHHIVSDGTSIGIMIAEFVALYSEQELNPLQIQYKDYAAWQQSSAQQERLQQQEAYWMQTLHGTLPVLEMPTDYARPAVKRHEGAIFEFEIDAERSAGLRKLAADSRTTLYMVLLAAYTIVLHKYSGQEDIIVGTPIAGRTHSDLQPLIGMFVNTLAIRNYPTGTKTVLSYLEDVKETALGAFEHQDYPFEDLVENVHITRDLSRHPVFDTMFALENTEKREFDLDGLLVKPFANEYRTAKFDLNLTVTEDEDGLGCSMEYATALYKEETIERMSKHFLQLIAGMINNPQALIASLPIVTDGEKQQLQEVFNNTAMAYPRDNTVHELFAAQVERTPDAPAVVFGSEQLTYVQLEQKANQLAQTLQARGVAAEQPVGIMVERSLEMVVAVLAVLKAGGTFVPIDPEYPETRIRYMLADSGAKLVLTRFRITGAQYVAPRTTVEMQLARIWQDVLGVTRVGVKDNFFELGGHSLRATTLVSRLYKEMNVNFPLRVVFQHPTVEEMAQAVAGMELQQYAAIPLAPEQAYYPLSSAQKRLYILSQLDGAELSYNMPGILLLEGPLNRDRFQTAFQQLISRHETLRTSFEMYAGEPVQSIQSDVAFRMEYIVASENQLESFIQSFVRAFDLSQAPLLRVGLVQLEDERHVLMFDMHHIISDGVTMGNLVHEFAQLYAGEQLPELRIQYKDYAAWQQSAAYSSRLARQESYWLERLAGELPVLELPTDYVRPPVQQFSGDVALLTLSKEQHEQLGKLAADHGATLYMVLLTAYTALLHKYTGQEDIIVGSPIAGRNHPDLEPLLGMFVNTLAIRNYPTREKTFLDLLAEVKDSTLEAFEHQDYPFENIVEKVQTARDMSRNPLFDTMFSLENTERGTIEFDGLQIQPYPHQHTIAKFDLTFHAEESTEGILCGLSYATSMYTRETAERMCLHFQQLIIAILQKPELKLSELQLTTAEEKERVLHTFNQTTTDYPRSKTIQHLFEEQVLCTPEAVAVSFGEETLSYSELNERANRLARTLRAKGVSVGSMVGLMTERSPEMIVAIMAILKAGGAYVPIDPEYPEDRIRYMMEDSGIRMMVVQRQLEANIPLSCDIITLEDEASYHVDGSNPEQHNGASDLAYVIYTSGTTGMPKGNLTTHRNIVRVVQHTNYINIQAEDVVLQLSSYAFDGSTFDIFGALLNGAKLVLISRNTLLDVGLLADLIDSEQITVMFITTAYFNVLVDMKPQCLRHIRAILFGGERVSVSHARKALQHLGPGKIKHVYGPTEATVFATSYDINEIADGAVTIPIGRPISNTSIYILDQHNNPQPIGVTGELCIAGDGVAKGYLNRADLTAAKFVDHPFVPGERMYRSGDLARWLPDGTIEYVGRIDDQVKIRGYRIELGEIEAHLLQQQFVQEAIVTVQETSLGEKRLAAYYVAERPTTGGELRITLAHELPSYMIPSYFVQLDKMPLSPNGKVNRKALPAPEEHVQTGAEFVAPRTPQEVQLAHIWQEALGLELISVKDNFFELGGHSLSLMQLVERIFNVTGVQIPLHSVFQRPTIEEMAMELLKSEFAGQISSPFVKLNTNGAVNVFCFPPGLGYGLTYLELAKQLEHECVLYGIDFIDDASNWDDMLNRYVDTIISIQPESPYVLLGYSLGGNLTFEVAKAMERRGYFVSDILMLDSLRKLSVHVVDEFEDDMDDMLDGVEDLKQMLLLNPSLRERVKHKMRTYWSYGVEVINSGVVAANIHAFLAAPSEVNQPDQITTALWKEATQGDYVEHSLSGEHEDILQPPYLESNVHVIRTIIHQIVKQAQEQAADKIMS
ncbi:non-ribosomal peptide synthetase [Paenibacillus taiwanensis]|uniref:non-ribosomal peptide synthetase n=1 Tax=Paenibacillus taiwanensis TaxID=401638 RepID=UPI000423918B|nr:non-ribosomal peptide synthetase [Paenibacillus taiwanensis]